VMIVVTEVSDIGNPLVRSWLTTSRIRLDLPRKSTRCLPANAPETVIYL
jgi:hypothetical protein